MCIRDRQEFTEAHEAAEARVDAMSEQITEMFNMITDLQQGMQEILEQHRMHQGGSVDGSPAAQPDESNKARADLKDSFDAWKSSTARKCWILTDTKPAMVGCKQAEL